jgi:hypothetical protein
MRENIVALAFAAGAAASPFDKNKWHFAKKPHGWYVKKLIVLLVVAMFCADQDVHTTRE